MVEEDLHLHRRTIHSDYLFGSLVKPSLQQAKGLAPSFVLVAMWAGILWLPTIACFWARALALKIVDVI